MWPSGPELLVPYVPTPLLLLAWLKAARYPGLLQGPLAGPPNIQHPTDKPGDLDQHQEMLNTLANQSKDTKISKVVKTN